MSADGLIREKKWKDKPRPTPSHREVLRRYWTDERVRKVASGTSPEDDIEVCRDELIEAYDYSAYRYAKNLDDDYHWDIDKVDWNRLDVTISKELRECIVEWAKVNEISPKLKIGDRVSVAHSITRNIEFGTISAPTSGVRIYNAHPEFPECNRELQYYVKLDGSPDGSYQLIPVESDKIKKLEPWPKKEES